MKERIKELAKQSGLIQYDSDSKLSEVEKFAELIVKECMEQVIGQYPPAMEDKETMKDTRWDGYVQCGVDSNHSQNFFKTEKIMKPQKPAQGILCQNDWGDYKMYEVSCDCTDTDHSHLVTVEADDATVTVYIYTNSTTPWWSRSRWRQIWQILTRGYCEMQAVTLLQPQQAINYASALTQAAKDVVAFRKNKLNKKV